MHRLTQTVFAVAFYAAAAGCASGTSGFQRDADPYETGIDRSWLQRPVTLEELEVELSYAKSPSFLADFEQFKSKIQPGDEIWYYSSPPETWEQLMGDSGYTIVREGRMIATLRTVVN